MAQDVQGPESGPSEDADLAGVELSTGTAGDLGEAGAGDAPRREVGVTAAVERGPAELSDEGEPVREDPHASTEDREPARSTDEL